MQFKQTKELETENHVASYAESCGGILNAYAAQCDHFREMLINTHKRGLKPEYVVKDCWYSSLDNLKCIRQLGWIWVMGLKSNRHVNRKQELRTLDIPEQGVKVHLKGYGFITVFRFVSRDGRTDYVGTNQENPTREEIKKIFKGRWEIEVYHRELKQTCGLEKCQSHSGDLKGIILPGSKEAGEDLMNKSLFISRNGMLLNLQSLKI
jgi:hypothetical protein